MPNLNRLIADAGARLREVGIDSGEAEAEIVLCDLLDCDRLFLYMHGPSMIDEALIEKFQTIITKRLSRYPLQYILGSAWFYGRKFIVNEAVMVPCPETELLLESVMRSSSYVKSNPIRLLDIGTGSGVVALSAQLENDALDVTATDISSEALAVAKLNAGKFEIEDKIKFVESDLFEALDKSVKFDIIASNPPYIQDDAYDGLPPEVKADPRLALTSGVRGLDIIEKLIAQAPDYLNRPGYLMFEIGYDQSEALFEMITSDERYFDFSLLKDMAEIDRVVVARLK